MNPTASPKAAGEDLRHSSVQLLIVVGGILTSLVTVGINYALSSALDFDLLSLSFWFVIPAGAAMGGMLAASGYYAAARLTQTMPSRSLLFNMVAVGASTWILSKWLSYATMRLEDGTRVASLVSFWDYFKISTNAMRLTIGTRYNPSALTTEELGSLGYVREILQVLGFMAGGFFVYAFLTEVEACSRCRRYAKTKILLGSGTADKLDALLLVADISLPHFVEDARATIGGKVLEGFYLSLSTCPSCHEQWLHPGVVLRSGNRQELSKLARYSVTPEIAHALSAATH